MQCNCKFVLMACAMIIIKQKYLISSFLKIGIEDGDRLIVNIKACKNCNKKTAYIEPASKSNGRNFQFGTMINDADVSLAEELIKECEIKE